MPRIGRNPITRQPLADQQSVETQALGEAALRTLVIDAGYAPQSLRVRGNAKVVAFHVANALTLGIVGQFGALCSKSSYMASQKENHPLKDFGQTYLNATINKTTTWGKFAAGSMTTSACW